MKLLYIGLGLVGAIVPTLWVYILHLPHAISGLPLDLGLLFFSLGIGLIFSPLGAAGGLVIAVIIHLTWSLTHIKAPRVN